MKTLNYSARPIGRWLAIRLERAGKNVTPLARAVRPELLELTEEFELTATVAEMTTPTPDRLIEGVRRSEADIDHREVA